MSQKVTIQIFGNKYPITTQEDPAYVSELGREIDVLVEQLMNTGKPLSINEALVLIALNYLDASKKAEQGSDNLRRQVTRYADETAKAQAQLAQAKKEIEKLRARLDQRGKNA